LPSVVTTTETCCYLRLSRPPRAYRGTDAPADKPKSGLVHPNGCHRTDSDARLHASDIARNPHEEAPDRETEPNIRDCVHEGDELLVQVLKDPLGTKGARLTTYVTIPSRFLVMMPNSGGIGVSGRIEDETERERLRSLVEGIIPSSSTAGYIVRTAAEGASVEALRADMIFLQRLWEAIEETARHAKAGQLVHEDLSLPLRVLRDLMSPEIERVRVDSEPVYGRMREFAERFIPQMAPMMELYTQDRPIFDLYGTEDEIDRALKRKVALKSGGYVIFDQTEAMTTIDNCGGGEMTGALVETILDFLPRD
jgi:ribonuclease G